MFNFTTQTVYNDINDKNMWINTGKKPALRIGNTRFDADIIESVLIKLPTLENLAEVTFDIGKIKSALKTLNVTGSVTARFVFYIGLTMNYQDPFYANDLVYKGKPLYIEFQFNTTDADDVITKKVKDLAKKYLLLIQSGREKILDIETIASSAGNGNNNATAGKIKFKAVNSYQIIRKANLQWFNPDAKKVDCCTNDGEFQDLLIGVPVMYTTNAQGTITSTNKVFDGVTENGRALADNEVAIIPGSEAFCDYNWIIHNLRLPTAANYYPWSPANRMGEIPVPGQVYTQFIITIKKERDGIMGEIVGARGVSITTHVLYVAGAAALNTSVTTTPADKVYKALVGTSPDGLALPTTGGAPTLKIYKTADTALANPFA